MSERSFLAGASEPAIRLRGLRRKFADPAACSAYISKMAKVGKQPYTLPFAVRRSDRISESSFDGKQIFEVRPPEVSADSRLRILYLHGGSYFAPPNLLHWEMLLRLSELTGAVFDLPIYPRAPLHTVSAAYGMISEMYGAREYCMIMGDSAGGGLALGFAQTLNNAPPLILMSPWLDAALENPRIAKYEQLDALLGSYGLRRLAKLWAGSLDVADPRVSPINGDMSSLAETVVLVGTHEIFCPDAERLAEKLETEGKRCRIIKGEGMGHVWCSYPTREGREALARAALIINEWQRTGL